MTKKELRKKYKTLRGELTTNEIESYSLDISNMLLSMNIWDSSFYHIFLSIEEHNEINTDYIVSILSGKDKNIVISKSYFEQNQLTNFL